MILPEHITNWQKEYHIKNVQMPEREAVKAAWLVISPIICQLWGGHHNVDIWVGGNCFSFPNQGKERYIFGLIVVRYVKACWFQSRSDGWFPWILNNILSCIYKIPTKFMTNLWRPVQLLYWDCLVKCQLRVKTPRLSPKEGTCPRWQLREALNFGKPLN
jgi:hypothetical protein